MKKPVFAFTVSICAIALTVGAALAKPMDHGAQMSFEALDGNADGQISRDEMAQSRQDHIARADADGDGALSLKELEDQAVEQAKSHAGRMMARADSNGDGVLSGDELAFGDRDNRRFDRMDRNGDGAISKAEFDRMRGKMGHGHRAPDAD